MSVNTKKRFALTFTKEAGELDKPTFNIPDKIIIQPIPGYVQLTQTLENVDKSIESNSAIMTSSF